MIQKKGAKVIAVICDKCDQRIDGARGLLTIRLNESVSWDLCGPCVQDIASTLLRPEGRRLPSWSGGVSAHRTVHKSADKRNDYSYAHQAQKENGQLPTSASCPRVVEP